jgi:cell division protein FtsL
MERLPQNQANSKIHRERGRNALSRLALLLFCGVVLTGGFLFAAREHFAAIQYGYQNEELRREQQRLDAEQKRLLLEKEAATSPSQVEPAARQIGLRPLQPGQIVTTEQIVTKTENRASELHTAVPGNPSASLRR